MCNSISLSTNSFVRTSVEDVSYNHVMSQLSRKWFEKISFSKSPAVPLDYERIKQCVEKIYSVKNVFAANNLYYFFKFCLECGPMHSSAFRYSATKGDFSIPSFNERGFTFGSSLLGLIKKEGVYLYFKTTSLGKGSFKNVYAGVEAFVDENSRDVLQPFTRYCTISEVLGASRINVVLEGVNMQSKILNIPKSEEYFISAPYFVLTKDFLGFLTAPYYQASLKEAVVTKSILKSPQSNEKIRLNTVDFIGFCKNIVEGVELLGENGFFHKDLRLPNVLLKLEGDGKTRAYIADFDLSTEQPFHSNLSNTFIYWNRACQLGYASKETDLFGLVFLIAVTLLLEGTENLDSVEKDLHKKTLVTCEHAKQKYWSTYKGLLTQNSFNAIFDLLAKALSADLSSKIEIEGGIRRAQEKSEICMDVVSKYYNDELSPINARKYETLLEKLSLNSFIQKPFPTIDEIKNVLNSCEVSV